MDHIYKYNVTPPAMNHTDYYNRKVWYSMLVQAVVNHNYLFKDIHIGWPGRVHNARVLVLVPDPQHGSLSVLRTRKEGSGRYNSHS